MIRAGEWFEEAIPRGFDFFTGVPCSFLTPFINYSISDERTRYVGAASEGEAVAIAAGAWLGGRKAVVMCQNSGFGNMVNPLTSLSSTFAIPTLLVVTWRGQPGLKDEPQHRLMGASLPALLDAIEIPHALFPSESGAIATALRLADETMEKCQLPYAFVMQKGSVAPEALRPRPLERGAFPTQPLDLRAPGGAAAELPRRDALALALEALGPECAYLATTGKLGRELFSHADSPNHFYHVGAMGCVSGVGLGLALTRPNQRVVVLDGDGSLLMKMGTLATIGHYAPRNLVHLVFDNECHESTGRQATVSSTVEFARIAVAAGYRRAYAAASRADWLEILEAVRDQDGPVLVHQKVGVATDPGLCRPTLAPRDVARRLREWLGSAPS